MVFSSFNQDCIPYCTFLLVEYKFLILDQSLDFILLFLQALEKSKYEQSLESVRRFIAIAEKELELYYRHIALYGDPNNRNPLSVLDGPNGDSMKKQNHGIHEQRNLELSSDYFSAHLSETEADSTEMELSETEDNFGDENLSMDESDSEDDSLLDSSVDDQEREVYFTNLQDESVTSTAGSSSMSKHTYHYGNQSLLSEQMPFTRD